MCAFKDGVLLKMGRNLSNAQSEYFKSSVAHELNEDENDLVIDKYLESDLSNCDCRRRNPKFQMVILESQIEIHELVETTVPREIIIDTNSYPIQELSNIYNESDMANIIANREFLENGGSKDDLPFSIPEIQITIDGTIKVRTKISDVFPV